MLRDKEKLISEVGSTYEKQKQIRDYQREKCNRDFNVTVSKCDSKDEKLYKRVCDILDSDELIINPIARLIDNDEYGHMNDEEKQRYVLELSAKFRELKERYDKEKIGKTS